MSHATYVVGRPVVWIVGVERDGLGGISDCTLIVLHLQPDHSSGHVGPEVALIRLQALLQILQAPCR